MPLVTPLPADHDPEVAELSKFFEGTRWASRRTAC
jgi:hypothetical protein